MSRHYFADFDSRRRLHFSEILRVFDSDFVRLVAFWRPIIARLSRQIFVRQIEAC
jgi:hypothetical protein